MRLHPGGITIRPLQAGDFDSIRALIRQIPGYIYRWAMSSSLAAVFQRLLEGKSQEAFVAILQERVIGFISLCYIGVLHRGGTVASIQELVVTEELRGRGVGTALIEFARARASELQCAAVEVACGASETDRDSWPEGRGRKWASLRLTN